MADFGVAEPEEFPPLQRSQQLAKNSASPTWQHFRKSGAAQRPRREEHAAPPEGTLPPCLGGRRTGRKSLRPKKGRA